MKTKAEVVGQQSDGDGGVGGKEGDEDQGGGGWITSGTTCRRDEVQNCFKWRRLVIRNIELTYKWERMWEKETKKKLLYTNLASVLDFGIHSQAPWAPHERDACKGYTP